MTVPTEASNTNKGGGGGAERPLGRALLPGNSVPSAQLRARPPSALVVRGNGQRAGRG